MPEICEFWVHRDTVPVAKPERKFLVYIFEIAFYRAEIDLLPEFERPPLKTVRRRHQRMIILKKIAVIDQNLSHIKNLFDLIMELPCLFFVADMYHVPAKQAHSRTVDAVHRTDACCFAGTFDPYLGAWCKKTVGHDHGCRRDPGSGKSGVSRPSVPEPEPARHRRVRKDRSAGD